METPREFLSDPLPAEPLLIAQHWLEDAWERRLQPNPNAMVLATTAHDGQPQARVVLCKKLVAVPGYLVFYTHYASRKGRDLEQNPRAAAVMHWDQMQRQLRITGTVMRSPAAESDEYFATRPWPSRLGAWASEQSAALSSRRKLEEALAAAAHRFGTPPPTAGADPNRDFAVPRPAHWGGFRLWAESVELWVGGDARIHDRALWTRSLAAKTATGFNPGPWSVTRLQP